MQSEVWLIGAELLFSSVHSNSSLPLLQPQLLKIKAKQGRELQGWGEGFKLL